MVKLVFTNDTPKELRIPTEILPSDGKPQSHHFLSTPCDNLIELAGRVCYDSAASTTKTRGSEDYHKHINEVNHGSVQEHMNIVFDIETNPNSRLLQWSHPAFVMSDVALMFINRPGVYLKPLSNNNLRLVMNVRAIKEWWQRSLDNEFHSCEYYIWFGQALYEAAKTVCPLALGDKFDTISLPEGIQDWENPYLIKVVKPDQNDKNQIWASFYINGVSRGLTHELVRHKWQTAVSQRSTRYVDESESDWAWHPLIEKYKTKFIRSEDDYNHLRFMDYCQGGYLELCNSIEHELLKEGIDKFTARKQARGAARGILGNALSTEVLFSASIAQWERIILQRCNNAADAEIRQCITEVFKILTVEGYLNIDDYTVVDSVDGIGCHVIKR